MAKIKNFKYEKETIAIAKTPGHRKKQKVIGSLPLDWWIRFIASQVYIEFVYVRKSCQMIYTLAQGVLGRNRSFSVGQVLRSARIWGWR